MMERKKKIVPEVEVASAYPEELLAMPNMSVKEVEAVIREIEEEQQRKKAAM